MAAALEREQDLPRRNGPLAAQILRPRHVSLSFGSGPARRASAGLHRLGHLFALQTPQGIQRPAPDGLRRVRSSGRAVRHPDGTAPGRDDRAQHRPLPRAARQDRLLVRLGPRGAHVRSEVLQVDAVGLPQNVRLLLLQRQAAGASDRGAERRLHDRNAFHGRGVERLGRGAARAGAAKLPSGLPSRHDGELVSEAGHGAGQRRGARRTVGARRLSRGAEAHEAMAAPRDGLRPADARRAGGARME